ncbi:MAG: dTDP-4-dehydrorhamnose reductase [Candidatus Eiseniibacteriota bacterium]
MRILVTGAHGMLGQDLVPHLSDAGHDLKLPAHGDVALEDEGALDGWLGRWRPERIFHLAAWTDVDGCEKDPDRARRSNVAATGYVAALAAASNAELLYLSTDYVFDGSATRPIPVEAQPHPLGVYGTTKWEGEQIVRRLTPKHWIVRVSWLCGPHGRNFIEAIKARIAAGQPLSVVTDQTGAPTFTFDLAPALVRLPEVAEPGIYHVTNRGICTWYEFAAEIVRRSGADVPLRRTTTCELNRPAPRPAYSVLDTSKAEAALGSPMPTWQDALDRYDRATGARGAMHV